MHRLGICVALLLLLIPAGHLRAETTGTTIATDQIDKGAFGLGLVAGDPTGLSAKLYLGAESDIALQASAGAAILSGGLQVNAELLWHPWILTNESAFVLPAYFGVGGTLRADSNDNVDDLDLGARGIVGLVFDFKNIDIDAFIELAAIGFLRFSDDASDDGFGFDVDLAAGARYYF